MQSQRRQKAVIPGEILPGIMCDYDKIFEIVEAKKSLFHPANELQEKFGRVIVVADAAHAFGSRAKRKEMWTGCRFHKLFLPCGKEPDDSGRWRSHMASDRRCG